MHIETAVIRLMSKREGWVSLNDNAQVGLFPKEFGRVIKAIGRYYRSNPDATEVDTELFTPLFYDMNNIEEEEWEYYDTILENIGKDVSDAATTGLIHNLKERNLYHELSEVLQNYDSGAEVDLYEEVEASMYDHERDLRAGLDHCDVNESLEEIIEEMESGTRFQWAIGPLRDAMPDLCTGKQVIFGARPGTGKTSCMLYNTARMAPDVPDGRCILWLCNEGKGTEVKFNLYRTLLEGDKHALVKHGGKVCADIAQQMGCGTDRFIIKNIHGMNVYQVERLIQQNKPIIVIWDMIDNIRGFEDSARPDIRLERLYQWARELAVIYDFLSLPTSQTSQDAENLPFPLQGMLKDSKTAKQGACDGIIMMGTVTSPGKEHYRYFWEAKGWKGAPAPGADPTGRCVAEFNYNKCIFENVNPIKEA